MLSEVRNVPVVPRRPADSHKGTYGHVLVVVGSLGLTGAPALSAEAALRAGAGLVTCACPAHLQPVLAIKLTEAMTWPLPTDAGGCLNEEALRILLAGIERFDALVIGPGLGRHTPTLRFVAGLLAGAGLPAVVDADALLAWPGGEGLPAQCAITPHPGEFARLMGCTAAEVQSDRRAHAAAFTAAQDCVLVLKGHATLVADRERIYVNATGNPGMATGGAGDVLAGVMGALLGRGIPLFEAATLGVWVHGRAGDMARDAVGEDALLARDIIAFLGAAMAERGAPSDPVQGEPK